MLREARFQVCHELLERGDLLKRGLVLELEILHDLRQGTHDRLDARRRARPISLGDTQSRRQVIHRRESASVSSACQLTRF